ncbi:MAG: substrate-binding domain-containing protein [Clostridia bacterium]|nr:substrate-binding domain-containing protein [Clostridia bacterium]
MKNGIIYVFVQPGTSNYYWAKNIFDGIRQASSEWQDNLRFCTFDDEGITSEINGEYALAVGNDLRWMETVVHRIVKCGAHPVVVNASMIPMEQLRCSGVVFELEEALRQCVDLFRASGRKKTALLALNPNSVADTVKAAAFDEKSNIIFANDGIEECVSRFVDGLSQSGYDSVICSNDTVAVCLIKLMQKKGFVLPESLYIVGMGNSYVGSEISVPLTGITFDYRKMGEMAVRLYHNLRTCHLPCHMIASLPCGLVVRSSAPIDIEKTMNQKELSFEINESGYFTGDTVNEIINTEAMFQESDDIDREILLGVAKGEDCDSIAERIFLSGRAVRYRLAKILKKYGYSDRSELKTAIRRVINDESGEV